MEGEIDELHVDGLGEVGHVGPQRIASLHLGRDARRCEGELEDPVRREQIEPFLDPSG